MKKIFFRLVSLCLILVMTVTLFTACGSSNSGTTTTATASANSTSTETKAEPLTKYTITALFPGDTPNGFETVIAEAEKRLQDTLNVKLDFQFVSWADYGNKVMLKMTAGDDLDLHLNAPWLSINQMITNKMIQPWDDLLAKGGPDVIKQFPKAMIDYNKFFGKVYGIPLGNSLAVPKQGQVVIRGDLREKYGLQPIKSIEEFETYLLKVKENEKGMIPLTWNAASFAFPYFSTTICNEFAFGQNNATVQVPFNDDGSITLDNIKPIYEYPAFIIYVNIMHEWYQKGIIDKDIMSQKDGKGAFLSGKAAASNSDYMDELKLAAAVPGAKIEMTDLFADKKQVSDFKLWNFLCLNAKTKDADRVMMFYNWIFADEANYDLFQYGIKDVHWVDTGKGTYDIPDGVDASTNYNFPGYVLLWNPNFDRVSAKNSEGYKNYNAFFKNPDNFVKSCLTGFNPNYDNIKNEVAKVSAVWPVVINGLQAGVLEPDKNLAIAKTKLEGAGYLKIVEEAKKQIGDYIAAK